jgi:hypothetical protein
MAKPLFTNIFQEILLESKFFRLGFSVSISLIRPPYINSILFAIHRSSLLFDKPRS